MTLNRGAGKRSFGGTVRRRTARASLAALAALGISVFGMSAGQAASHHGTVAAGHDDSYGVWSAPASYGVSRVKIVDDSFSPKVIVVRVGTTVVWTNTDKDAHTVTRSSPHNPLDSGRLKGGKSYSFTFHRPGRFIYHCEYHHFMHGTVVVLPGRYGW